MKYVINVEEIVRRINAYTIVVDDEDEAEELLDNIEDSINNASHPDDIVEIIQRAGYNVIEYCEGAEDCEYELI